MAQTDRLDVLFPPGRMVAGSIKEPRTQDSDGRPLTVKSGPNAGQPRVEYSFGVAIPKNGEQHWNQTPWGATIWNAAAGWFPQGQSQSPNFSWKIADGDSQVPNTKGVRNCDREGYPGHWVVYFSSGMAPRTYNRDGSQPLEAEAFERGYFVEVFGNVASNGQTQQPGIYVNHSMVALNGYGEVIRSGPDPSVAGFGQAGMAPGAQQTPAPGMAPGAQQTPAQTPAPGMAPGAQQAPAPAQTPPPAQTPVPGAQHQQPPPTPGAGAVQPDHGFVQQAAAPPPVAERQWIYEGVTYPESALLAVPGWTLELIGQHCQPA